MNASPSAQAGPGNAPPPPDKGSDYYDDHYYSGLYDEHPLKSYYRLVYQRVVERAMAGDSILEVGSGTGGLAMLLLERNKTRYRGFDFSATAVARAGARLGRPDLFSVGDARDASIYAAPPFDMIVCMEVLEHIAIDREVIGLWPSGTRVVCTVPNFPAPSHVRVFRHEREVRERFGDLIAIERIERIARPVFTGLTAREWLKHLIWKRGDPKRLLGHLGIKRFDWGYGWFVFSGRRR